MDLTAPPTDVGSLIKYSGVSMERRRQFLAIALVIATTSSCRPPGPSVLGEADKAAIQATIDSALKIANTTPFDAPAYIKAYYADDAVYMAPNEKSLSGATAMLEWFKALPPPSNVKFTLAEIEGTGAVAILRGTYTFTVTPAGSPPIVDTGKYLEVWKKRPDGSWRSSSDIFNSDIPVPAPPALAKQ